MRLVLLAAILAAALAPGAASATPGTQLRVTLWPQGQGGPSKAWTVACAPARGTHPSPGRACTTLSRLPQPLRPVPPDAICTQVYGGPQEALVTGTLKGRRVWARFHLRDGCQIARWNRLVPLLPAAGRATS